MPATVLSCTYQEPGGSGRWPSFNWKGNWYFMGEKICSRSKTKDMSKARVQTKLETIFQTAALLGQEWWVVLGTWRNGGTGNERESLPRRCIERGWVEFKQRSLDSVSSFPWFTQHRSIHLQGCFRLWTEGLAAAGNEKPPLSLSHIDRSAASWDAMWAWAARGSLLRHQQPVPSAIAPQPQGGFLLLSLNLFSILLLTSLKQQIKPVSPAVGL